MLAALLRSAVNNTSARIKSSPKNNFQNTCRRNSGNPLAMYESGRKGGLRKKECPMNPAPGQQVVAQRRQLASGGKFMPHSHPWQSTCQGGNNRRSVAAIKNEKKKVLPFSR